MSSIVADDPRLIWSGAISCESGAGWVKPWRIPHQNQDLYSPGNNGLSDRAEMPSGVRLRFATDARTLAFHTEPLAEEGNFDLYADDELVETVAYAAGQTEVRFDSLPAGDKTVELWLFPAMPVALRSIEPSERAKTSASNGLPTEVLSAIAAPPVRRPTRGREWSPARKGLISLRWVLGASATPTP